MWHTPSSYEAHDRRLRWTPLTACDNIFRTIQGLTRPGAWLPKNQMAKSFWMRYTASVLWVHGHQALPNHGLIVHINYWSSKYYCIGKMIPMPKWVRSSSTQWFSLILLSYPICAVCTSLEYQGLQTSPRCMRCEVRFQSCSCNVALP